ncbi:MAG: hypothetical protein HY260_11380, partial [Chloroflexi bacterium]|nr:hypothetical protein [Chloroflexota bacterium]
IAASRAADAVMLVALAGMAAIGSLVAYAESGDRRHLVVAAVAVGAGLAGGPRFVTLIFVLLIAAVLWRLLDGDGVLTAVDRLRGAGQVEPSPQSAGRARIAGIAIGVFLIGSSALLTYRPGLAASAQALPIWFAGWLPTQAGRDWLHLLTVLVVYEPLMLLFGLASMARLAIRGSQKRSAAWLSATCAIAAFAAGLVYAGRTSDDVVWIVIPLTGLASLFVVELLWGDWAEIDVSAVAVHSALVVVLLTYAGINVAAFSEAQGTLAGSAQFINLMLGGTAVLLVAVISLLFGVGWSAEGAARGAVVGMSVVLLFADTSGARHLTRWGESHEIASELWHSGASIPASGLRMLTLTLEDVSDRAVGAPHDIKLAVNAPRDGALAWALRDFHAASYLDALAATIDAPAVIAPAEQTTPQLGSAYVGQSFAVRARLDTAAIGPTDWVNWLAFRRAPLTMEKIVLWVRSDVQFRTGEGKKP